MGRSRTPRCSRCNTRPAVFGTDLCLFDIEYVTKRVAKAHDAIRRLNPDVTGDRFMALVRKYVEFGHEGHTYVARPGCTFCAIRA